jgi:opacity protein-like surface antigen
MRLTLLALFGVITAWGQSLGPGIKVGVPLSDAFQGLPGSGFSENKRYTAGFMLDVRLPAGLGIELDFLRRSLDYYAFGGGGFAGVQRTLRDSGGAWEFPLVGKYRLGAGLVKPYFGAGLAFLHLSGLRLVEQELRKRSNTGLVLEAGVEIRAAVLRVSPEIRYTHWGSENFQEPATGLTSSLRTRRNQAEFLIGVTF